jgi:hypothetical protein
MNIEQNVAETKKRLWISAVIIGVILAAVIVILMTGAGIPWYGVMAALILWGFAVLVLEGIAEDKVLVKAYGPTKKP